MLTKRINTLDFLKSVPIYPNKVMPTSFGIRNCCLPAETLLAEDDEGYVFFITEKDKEKTILSFLRQTN